MTDDGKDSELATNRLSMRAAAKACWTRPEPALNAAMETCCAKAAHEMNAELCRHLGDSTQNSWEFATNWQQLLCHVRVRFILANPTAGPEAAHNSWVREKLEDGWSYGDTRDAEKKTHPCLVPFANLPEEQQAKDIIFVATVRAVHAQLVREG